jgi:SAM-dependent methyltransferase
MVDRAREPMRLYERLPRLGYAAARILLPGGRWRYEGRGYCASCGNQTVFVLAEGHAAWVRTLAASWDNSAAFKTGLVTRESHICGLCGANYRMRAQARALLDRLGLGDTRALADRLRANPSFAIYETAHRNVFRSAAVVERMNYVQSEYLDGAKPGEIVAGVMNQNLEALTFGDASFDAVLTSEVLEHVADLDRALAEIARVLKPGGLHVFTVPSDPGLPRTVERARIVDGQVMHLLNPVTHGDSIRGEGILAFRDFGADAKDVTSRYGLRCEESMLSDASGFVTSVFVATKVA